MLCNGDTDDVVLFAVDWRLVTVRFESLYLNKADTGTACCYDNCYFCWVLNSLNLTVDGVDAPLLVYCYLWAVCLKGVCMFGQVVVILITDFNSN